MELESLDYFGGWYYGLYFHTGTRNPGRLYKVKIDVNDVIKDAR